MTSTNANIINSFTLIVIGLWGYFDVSAPTALIPVGFGAALILCSNGVKKQKQGSSTYSCTFNFYYFNCLSWDETSKVNRSRGSRSIKSFLNDWNFYLFNDLFYKKFYSRKKS